jgi:5'-3' exonuclease
MLPNDDHVICSTDSDFIQAIEGERIKLWNPIKKNFIKSVENYVVWKALRGDKSDNIPGVKGVGNVIASKLSTDEKKLNHFLESDPQKKLSFESSLNQILFEKVDQANIQFNCNFYDSNKLFNEFLSRNFNSITDKYWNKWNKTWLDLEEKCKHHSLMSNLAYSEVKT